MRRVERLADEIARERYRNARALFVRRGARPPFFLWAPQEDDLPLLELAQAVRWWSGLPRDDGLPAADPLTVEAAARAIDHLTVLEPVDGGRDFLPHPTGEGSAGRPLGREVDHIAVFAAAIGRAVVLRREPLYTVYEPAADFGSQCDRLILPLAGADGAVARLLVVTVHEAPLRTLIEVVMDPVLVFDESGRVRMVNRPAATLLGEREAELADRAVTTVLRAGFIATGLKGQGGVVTSARKATLRRADGGTRPVEVSIGETRRGCRRLFVAVLRDITAHKAEEDRYRTLALTDPLTGLANRILFQDRFAQAMKRSRRNRDHLALLMIDLDGFKAINDRHGHPAGDAVLREFALRVRSLVRQTDVLARLGGDEFALVQTDLRRPRDVAQVAERLLALIGEPFVVDGHRILLGASIGIAVYPDDADGAQDLMQRADRALYAAKGAGGNRWIGYRDLPATT